MRLSSSRLKVTRPGADALTARSAPRLSPGSPSPIKLMRRLLLELFRRLRRARAAARPPGDADVTFLEYLRQIPSRGRHRKTSPEPKIAPRHLNFCEVRALKLQRVPLRTPEG